MATLRFLSPLIKPDRPISGIRLSDQLHRERQRLGRMTAAENDEVIGISDDVCMERLAVRVLGPLISGVAENTDKDVNSGG
jgi:hypothetical protein